MCNLIPKSSHISAYIFALQGHCGFSWHLDQQHFSSLLKQQHCPCRPVCVVSVIWVSFACLQVRMIQQKKFLPFSRQDGHLSCNCCFLWEFLNTCLPTTLLRWLTVAHFLCMCLTHVLEIVAVRFFSFRQNLCGCAKVLHELLVFKNFIVVPPDVLTSLSAFHFHLCVSTFTPSCVIVNVKVISLPEISSLWAHKRFLGRLCCCKAPCCHLVDLSFLSLRSWLNSEWWT